jgi:hypothetical protein
MGEWSGRRKGDDQSGRRRWKIEENEECEVT